MSQRRMLSAEERVSWLRLSQTENIGPVTFRSLIGKYGSAAAALDALPDLARRSGANKVPRIYARSKAEDDIARAAQNKAQFVAPGEPGYPDDLRHIHGAPPLLCVAGKLELAQGLSIAIVGARNASAPGLKFTRMLAGTISEAGAVVVSGLARGIDTAAHQTALDRQTAAVVAGGVDYFYPSENEALQRDIASKGLLVSEMPPGTAPKAEHFPRRNRIISGMSRAVIVVEAALRSGSLITARFAAEQGREVFAVPGSPLDPRCQGCNRLIKDGANIITALEDALDVLKIPRASTNDVFLDRDSDMAAHDDEFSDDDRKTVLTLLSPTPCDIDDVARESGLPLPVVLAVILELEIAGRAERSAGNRVNLI